MRSRILDVDPSLGIERWFHYHDDGSFTIETRQNVTDIAERNKALMAQTDERAGWKGNWHRVASIPLSVYYDLMRKGIVDDEKALRRWLDDPDNRVFRTRPGRLSR